MPHPEVMANMHDTAKHYLMLSYQQPKQSKCFHVLCFYVARARARVSDNINWLCEERVPKKM